MDEYINKYLNILKQSEKSQKSVLISQRSSSITQKEPLSILERLTPKRKKCFTTTEEIYNEESNQFCSKIQSRNGTVSPESSKSQLPSSNSPALSVSPIKNKISHYNSTTIKETIKKLSLPILQKREKSIHSLSEPKYNKKNHKINSILSACEDTRENFSNNSRQLAHFISKERNIAKEYTKEIEWTSRKLNELDGYSHKIMKKLFEEYKSSNELYEKEKTSISKKYNTKTAQDYKKKVKGIKKLLTDYKLKIIP